MIVSLNTYYVILAVIGLLIIFVPFYRRIVKGKENKYDFLYLLALLILFPINFNVPAVFTIYGDKTYKKEVAVLPTNWGGMDVSYGRRTYIFNKSARFLLFQYYYYGNAKVSENNKNTVIGPGQVVMVNSSRIDYVFQAVSMKTWSRTGGAVKTSLNYIRLRPNDVRRRLLRRP